MRVAQSIGEEALPPRLDHQAGSIGLRIDGRAGGADGRQCLAAPVVT
jgi:hypothetical protein